MNRNRIYLTTGFAFAVALVGCASTPNTPTELARLDDEMVRLRADSRVAAHADGELDQAQLEIDFLHTERRSLRDRDYDHRVYLAGRLVEIAEAEGLARYADSRTQALTAERERLLLDARTRDVRMAEAAAARADAVAQAERARAEAERMRADSERHKAEIAQMEAARAQDDLVELQTKLVTLDAARTERGLVVTLGDVLFETGRAEIKSGATRNLDQLAEALRADPAHRVAIEGHTDSVGARDYNMRLSAARAEAVRSYLIAHGVAPDRVTSHGLGPDFPVATNGSESGRQQNRRVEVVVQQQVASVNPAE